MKYLDEIIDRERIDDDSEEQAAIERLESQIPYQLVVKVVKKQPSIWKRVVVFALGVVQVFAGALLIYESNGLLTSVGLSLVF